MNVNPGIFGSTSLPRRLLCAFTFGFYLLVPVFYNIAVYCKNIFPFLAGNHYCMLYFPRLSLHHASLTYLVIRPDGRVHLRYVYIVYRTYTKSVLIRQCCGAAPCTLYSTLGSPVSGLSILTYQN